MACRPMARLSTRVGKPRPWRSTSLQGGLSIGSLRLAGVRPVGGRRPATSKELGSPTLPIVNVAIRIRQTWLSYGCRVRKRGPNPHLHSGFSERRCPLGSAVFHCDSPDLPGFNPAASLTPERLSYLHHHWAWPPWSATSLFRRRCGNATIAAFAAGGCALPWPGGAGRRARRAARKADAPARPDARHRGGLLVLGADLDGGGRCPAGNLCRPRGPGHAGGGQHLVDPHGDRRQRHPAGHAVQFPARIAVRGVLQEV